MNEAEFSDLKKPVNISWRILDNQRIQRTKDTKNITLGEQISIWKNNHGWADLCQLVSSKTRSAKGLNFIWWWKLYFITPNIFLRLFTAHVWSEWCYISPELSSNFIVDTEQRSDQHRLRIILHFLVLPQSPVSLQTPVSGICVILQGLSLLRLIASCLGFVLDCVLRCRPQAEWRW